MKVHIQSDIATTGHAEPIIPNSNKHIINHIRSRSSCAVFRAGRMIHEQIELWRGDRRICHGQRQKITLRSVGRLLGNFKISKNIFLLPSAPEPNSWKRKSGVGRGKRSGFVLERNWELGLVFFNFRHHRCTPMFQHKKKNLNLVWLLVVYR